MMSEEARILPPTYKCHKVVRAAKVTGFDLVIGGDSNTITVQTAYGLFDLPKRDSGPQPVVYQVGGYVVRDRRGSPAFRGLVLMCLCVCTICYGEGWVCENHPDLAWQGGDGDCCGGAGMPCGCNPEAALPPGSVITMGYGVVLPDAPKERF